MARIRTVKPELFRHDGLFELEAETDLPIRLTWCALPTVCDREGRFKWKPRQLKLDILPYDDIDFSRVLDALLSRGFIMKYQHDGKDYGWIPTFKTHQVINNRESASTLPSPEESEDITREQRVNDASPTPLDSTQGEGKGKGKGREGEKEGKGRDTPAKPEFSDKDMELAQWMLSLITDAQPDFKKPNLKSWAKTIRLMRELDGRNHRDMAVIWKWAREDDFWQANILSADKFRKQYDRLKAQSLRPGSTLSKAQKDAQREEEIQKGFLADAPDDYQGGVTIEHEGDDDEPF